MLPGCSSRANHPGTGGIGALRTGWAGRCSTGPGCTGESRASSWCSHASRSRRIWSMAKYNVKVVGGGQESDPEILAMLGQAERDAQEEGAEVRVNFRWGPTQLALVKEAARAQGLPYQVYIKKVLYDRAKMDLAEHLQLERLREGKPVQ